MANIRGLDIGVDDLKQHYAGSYIQVSGKAKPTVVFVDCFPARETMSYITYENFKEYNPKTDHIRDLVPDAWVEMPKMGLFNFRGYVFYVFRKPHRQWSRGFKWENVKVSCRFPHGQGLIDEDPFGAAVALFQRQWMTPFYGIPLLRSESITSFAFNNTYWFSGNSKRIYLWRRHICIGEIIKNTLYYYNESTLLREEVDSFFKGAYETP